MSRGAKGGRWAAYGAAAAVLLAGCTSGAEGTGLAGTTGSGTSGSTDGQTSSTTSAPARPARLTLSPADGARDVMPDQPVTVQAMTGRLDGVTVRTAGGSAVEGRVTGSQWTSTGRLAPGSRYSVTTRSTGPDGVERTARSTFRTHEPAVTATYGMVYDGQTVGVAMPVSLQFDSAVTSARYRRAIEKAVTVTTSPRTQGSWGWLDDRQLMWRPKSFWKPGTTVTLDAPLTGFQTGEDKWVGSDVSGTMTIGREQLTTVDIAKHRLRVTRGGETVRSFPVSSGKPGPQTETRSGMKVVIGKQAEMTMDSETIGIDKGEPGYYKIDTDWNVRVTWTGEFLHSAPWSVGAQGSSNVSHGCVNLAPAAARWMYESSIPGDPVDFTGSSREFQPTEGIGVWQYDYAGWQEQSALR